MRCCRTVEPCIRPKAMASSRDSSFVPIGAKLAIGTSFFYAFSSPGRLIPAPSPRLSALEQRDCFPHFPEPSHPAELIVRNRTVSLLEIFKKCRLPIRANWRERLVLLPF